MANDDAVSRNLVFKCLTGSTAYGTSMEGSDVDIRGVFCADPVSVMTPFYSIQQVDGPGDTVIFELSKYIKLVCDQNPNIVELLWVDPSDILYTSPAWSILSSMRGSLLTTKVRATYGGFATQALKGMRGHERWINSPQPEKPPVPADFVGMVHNLSLGREFNRRVPKTGNWTAVGAGQDVYLLFAGGRGSWFDESGSLRTYTREEQAELIASGAPPAALIRFERKEYDARKRDHDNYWVWCKNRNKVRGDLEKKVGYDAKNAGHLIRLLRTAKEILTDGVVRVRRPDAAELLEIRRGEWPYEKVLAHAEEIDASLSAAEVGSPLPRTLDQAAVADAVMRMYAETWKRPPQITVLEKDPSGKTPFPPDPRGRVIALDVEMTGYSDAGRLQIVEIAAVEIKGGFLTGRSFHSYVNPDNKINPYARRKHGLGRKFLSGKPSFAEIAPMLLEFIGDSPLMAHNAVSDLHSLNHDMALSKLPSMPLERVFCSQRIGRALFGTDLNLDTLCDAFGVDRTPRERGHSALIDATILAECIVSMAEMPGYACVEGSLVRKKHYVTRFDRRAAADASPARCVNLRLSDDGQTALFSLKNGSVIEANVPDYPADSHRVVISKNALVIVTGDGTVPDNPSGPAVLAIKGGSLVSFWFEHGQRLKCPDASEPVLPKP